MLFPSTPSISAQYQDDLQSQEREHLQRVARSEFVASNWECESDPDQEIQTLSTMGYRYRPYHVSFSAVIFASHLVSRGQATAALFEANGDHDEHQLAADSEWRRQTAGDEDPSVFLGSTDEDSAAPPALDNEDKEPDVYPAAFLGSEVASTTGRREAKTHQHTQKHKQKTTQLASRHTLRPWGTMANVGVGMAKSRLTMGAGVAVVSLLAGDTAIAAGAFGAAPTPAPEPAPRSRTRKGCC